MAGGGTGLLAALGVIAIPGIGPLVAAGVLATTLVGAAGGSLVGGLLGALTDYGVDEKDAHVYSEGVRRGGTLVTVRADDARVGEAERILNDQRPVDIAARRKHYRMRAGPNMIRRPLDIRPTRSARNASFTASFGE